LRFGLVDAVAGHPNSMRRYPRHALSAMLALQRLTRSLATH
jgi:hypothetical protein